MAYFDESIKDVFSHLESGEGGLTKAEVERRQLEAGKNELGTSGGGMTRLAIFLRQFQSILMLVLIAAGGLSVFLGEYSDAIVIVTTVAINALIGFFQEDKADRALKTLNAMVEHKALVLRDGKKELVPSDALVAGDILFLQAGDQVPADARLFQVKEFRVNEAVLTGESIPVAKKIDPVSATATLGDQLCMVFRGTTVLNGTAVAVVTTIGQGTALGKIASLVATTLEEETPLQKSLDHLSKNIALLVVGLAILLFLFGSVVFSHYSLIELFKVSVAVAVAAIPEGLVISLTISLAVGMTHMLRKQALVRKLLAAETLGSVSVICVDKTGTITEGEMTTVRYITPGAAYDINRTDPQEWSGLSSELQQLLLVSHLCNDAVREWHVQKNEWITVGDTTDVALMRAVSEGYRVGDDLFASYGARIDAIPFSSERMYMAALHHGPEGDQIFVKGAPEVVLTRSTTIMGTNKEQKLATKVHETLTAVVNEYSSNGYRVLALATKKAKGKSIVDGDISDLTFVGFAVFSDPIRAEVPEMMTRVQAAGITTIMITGDHLETARHIGRQIGLLSSEDVVFDGRALNAITDLELQSVVKKARIFARVDPVHKIRIVRALKANGEVVAMTGDGVNDAPAIKGADIGISLGSGSDVAKETADMVLLDNSFKSIVSAVEEGRTIYQNIQRIVLYLLSGSFSEVAIVAGSIFVGLPLPALPSQILWSNIVEDVFPNIALAFDEGEQENMKDIPRKRKTTILNREMIILIVTKSFLSNAILFALFVWVYMTTHDIVLSRTVVFVGFGIDMFYLLSARSFRRPFWKIRIPNVAIPLSLVFGLAMLVSAVYFPPFQRLLSTVPLAPVYWLFLGAYAIVDLIIIETVKALFLRHRHHTHA